MNNNKLKSTINKAAVIIVTAFQGDAEKITAAKNDPMYKTFAIDNFLARGGSELVANDNDRWNMACDRAYIMATTPSIAIAIRTCHRCGTVVGKHDCCPICTDELKYAKPVDMMTPQERLTEFDSWFGVLETEFGTMYERLEHLVGRGIYTQEFAYGKESMRREILNGKHPETIEDTMKGMPQEVKDKFIVHDMRDPSTEGFSEN